MISDFLLYPGLAFILLMSFLYSGILRKLAARMQNRIGPPVWQPLLDFIKLLGKEDIVPAQARAGYTAWPFLAAASVIVAALMIPVAGETALPFQPNVLVIFYFLAFSTVSLAMCGFASSNPFGSFGAVRKVMMSVSYEFPFLVAILVPSIHASSFNPVTVGSAQLGQAWVAGLFPLAFIAFMVATLAKTETPPFHIPGAHQEIVSGYYTEFTGTRLAFIELAHFVKLFALVSLGVVLFLGGSGDILAFVIKSLVLLFFIVLARAGFARLRIGSALRVGWLFGGIALIDLVRVILL